MALCINGEYQGKKDNMIIAIIIVILVFVGLAGTLNDTINLTISEVKDSKVRRYNKNAPRQSEFVRIVDRDEDGSLYAYIIENGNGTRRKVYANKDRFVITVGDVGTATYFSNYYKYYILEEFEMKKEDAVAEIQ